MAELRKWLLHLSKCTTRSVITAPSPSSIYPSFQHYLLTSGSISHLTSSFSCHLPVLLCACHSQCCHHTLLHLSLPFLDSALSPFSSIHSFSTSVASLSGHTSPDFRSNEPSLWRQWKAPFITIFFWPHYFPIHHRLCVGFLFFLFFTPSDLPVNTAMMTLSSSGR